MDEDRRESIRDSLYTTFSASCISSPMVLLYLQRTDLNIL